MSFEFSKSLSVIFLGIGFGLFLLGHTAVMAQSPTVPSAAEQIRELKAMVEALQKRVDELESAQRERKHSEPPPLASGNSRSSPVSDGENRESPLFLEYSKSGAERQDTESFQTLPTGEDPPISFKGAIRYNAIINDQNVDTKRGETGLDLFRIGADGQMGDFQVSGEYRFYPFMNTLHHG